MEGAKMVGRMGGRIFAYMVGRWGALQTHVRQFVAKKWDFEFRNLIEI